MSLIVGGLTMTVVGAAVGLAVTAAAVWYALPFAARRLAERQLRALCAARRVLVLTFDDGPGPDLTPRVLDVLAEHDARASFFVLGRRAQDAPELLDQIAAAGHEIGSHSQSHLNAWKTFPLRAARDAEESYRSLARWVAHDGVFRAPYGKTTLDLWWNARRSGRDLAWWTDVSGDTFTPIPQHDRLLNRVRERGGGVVLLHDFDRRTADAAARADYVVSLTAALLTLAAAEGWTVATMSELLDDRESPRDGELPGDGDR